MAFVFEKLREADTTRYDWTIFKGWFGHLQRAPWYWVIDRERDVFLIGVQNAPHETEEYPIWGMYWKGSVIRIEALDDGYGTIAEGVDSVWKIRRVHIPTEISHQRENIFDALKEAIKEWPVNPLANIWDNKPITQKSLTINFEGASSGSGLALRHFPIKSAGSSL